MKKGLRGSTLENNRALVPNIGSKCLLPDIQEHILFLERVDGVEPILERKICGILRFEGWGEQREKWYPA